MLKLSEMYIDQQVYWTDPDEGISSGVYMITYINAEDFHTSETPDDFEDILVLLRNDEGTEVEAFNRELTQIK